MGTARLASQPHSPAGAGQAGPLCVCVWGGCRTTLLGWRERGRPAPDWPPPAPSRALGGGGPCLRTCFQAGVGGSSRSPSVPPSLLSPRSVQDPAGCQGGPRPSRRLHHPPRCVRTRARWGCVPGAGGGTRGSGFTSPGPRQVRVDGSLAKWSVSPSQGDLPAWGTLSATEPILESPEISGSESLHCLSASTLGRHPGPSDGAVQSGRWAGAAWTAVQTGRARATRGEARPPRVGPGLGHQAGPGDRLHLTLPRVPWRKRC